MTNSRLSAMDGLTRRFLESTPESTVPLVPMPYHGEDGDILAHMAGHIEPDSVCGNCGGALLRHSGGKVVCDSCGKVKL